MICFWYFLQTIFYRRRVIHEYTSAPCETLAKAYDDSVIQFLKADFNAETLSWLERRIESWDMNVVPDDNYTRAELQAWCDYLEEVEEEEAGEESVFVR